jgi:hypothetical protein
LLGCAKNFQFGIDLQKGSKLECPPGKQGNNKVKLSRSALQTIIKETARQVLFEMSAFDDVDLARDLLYRRDEPGVYTQLFKLWGRLTHTNDVGRDYIEQSWPEVADHELTLFELNKYAKQFEDWWDDSQAPIQWRDDQYRDSLQGMEDFFGSPEFARQIWEFVETPGGPPLWFERPPSMQSQSIRNRLHYDIGADDWASHAHSHWVKNLDNPRTGYRFLFRQASIYIFEWPEAYSMPAGFFLIIPNSSWTGDEFSQFGRGPFETLEEAEALIPDDYVKTSDT